MGTIKETQRGKVEQGIESGENIKEIGSKHIEEANVSAEALASVEGVDDDDKQAVETARSEAASEAANIADSEIRSPGEQVVQGFQETTSESNEYANREHSDATNASGMVAEYSGIGANLASSLEQSASEFENIAQQAESAGSDLRSAVEAMSSQLSGTFG